MMGKNYLENISFIDEIEKRLNILRGVSLIAQDKTVLIEESISSLLYSTRKSAGADKLYSLEDDLKYANDKIYQNISDKQISIYEASVQSAASARQRNTIGKSQFDTVNRVLTTELANYTDIKNSENKIQSFNDLANINVNVQKHTTNTIGSLDNFKNDIIKTFKIEETFTELDSLIQSQLDFNPQSISKDLLENVDLWLDEMESIKETFSLDELGKYNPNIIFNSLKENISKGISGGELLKNMVPSDFGDNFSTILSDIENISSGSIQEILNKLPENFKELDPMVLANQFMGPVNELFGELNKLSEIPGQITDVIQGALDKIPKNIDDVFNVALGTLPPVLQNNLGGLLDTLKTGDLTPLLSKSNIGQYLSNLPGLDELGDIIKSGDLSSLANVGNDLSGLITELGSLSNLGELSGDLANVVKNLPENLNSIVTGLGGLPDMLDLSNVGNAIENISGNITNIISDGIQNIQQSAINSLTSLGNIGENLAGAIGNIGGLFGANLGGMGPVIPKELW